MENFINEFKIYCENVEDTKGLEIVKEELFKHELDLEFFIQDNSKDVTFKENIVIIKEALRLSELLRKRAINARLIDKSLLRDMWKLFKGFSMEEAGEVFGNVTDSACDTLYTKHNKEYGSGLEEHELEKWYIDLFEIWERYFS
jgi:hypothetical protein